MRLQRLGRIEPLSGPDRPWRSGLRTRSFDPSALGARFCPLAGARGPAVEALAAQLASVRGEAAPTVPLIYDNNMAARVAAFQTTQGLLADGRAASTTFMQLARATGSAQREPRVLR